MATECTHATPVTCYAAGHFPPDPGEIARKRAAYLEAQANAGRGDVCACEDPNRADIPGNPAAVCGTCGGLLPGCEGCGAEAGEECRPDCTGRAQVTCDRCGARTKYGNDLCNACIESQHALGTPGEQVGDVYAVDIPEETVRALLGRRGFTAERYERLGATSEQAARWAAEPDALPSNVTVLPVTIGELIRIAADMIGAIPNDELGDEPAVSVCNAVSELVRRAAGLPEERQSAIDDAIAWANS